MKKRALFLDRDGTLIVEPTDNFQIDSLEKLEFLPSVITSLSRIVNQTDFVLIMVTNQDGLGTASFPEESFWGAHNKMLKILENEGVKFAKIHIDRSFEHENLPTRKPNIGMLQEYLNGEYDLAHSYVIGDRITDVELAQKLGTRSILVGDKKDERAVLCTSNWKEISAYLTKSSRTASVTRKTNETEIKAWICLDGTGNAEVKTGIGFFDHLIEQFAKHSLCDLELEVKGDLHIDEHHSMEDAALALGEAFAKAVGDKRGITRYGHFNLPMDDALAQVAVDLSGRPWVIWQVEFRREKIGDMPTEMAFHFFKSFTDAAKCNVNIKVEGENEHHKVEAMFKAFARAIRMAVRRTPGDTSLPTTKGML